MKLTKLPDNIEELFPEEIKRIRAFYFMNAESSESMNQPEVADEEEKVN